MGKTLTLANMVVRITGDASKYEKGVDDAQSKTKSLGKSFSKQIGLAAGLGFAAAGAAATKFAVDFAKESIQAFQTYENSMREVFTLMPGMSEQAMELMRQDVLDFGSEVGRTTDEVVPALYQAISAGVPADNVFDFLDTAHKAALGGVTDLETAVDGISSVVNAYGADVVSAAEASDLMFTAVKLGKTDFDQLSKSLFQVIPTASAIGVEFGDITAALAAMTAQGTPTSVATTQLRQMLLALNQEGSKTALIFEEVSGVRFKDFIAGGGNLQEALQLMEGAAADSNVSINDLFGSVEAGGAALTLTGSGTETFTNNLEEMESATGATDEAANLMSDSMIQQQKELDATTEEFKILLGEGLAPTNAAWMDFKKSLLEAGIIQLKQGQINAAAKESLKDYADEISNTVVGTGYFTRGIEGLEAAMETVQRRSFEMSAEWLSLDDQAQRLAITTKLLEEGFEGTAQELIDQVNAIEKTEDAMAAQDIRLQQMIEGYRDLYGIVEDNTEGHEALIAAANEEWAALGELSDATIKQSGVYLENTILAEYLEEQKLDLAAADREAAEAAEEARLAELQRLEDVSNKLAGDYMAALEPAIESTDSLEYELWQAVAAAGGTAAELGVLGIALGLFDKDAANSALQTALIKKKIDELAQAYIDGEITVYEMRGELGEFITGLEDLLEPAEDAGEAIGDVQEEAQLWIDGSPYEAQFDADTMDALGDIEDLGEAARASAGHYNIHYNVSSPGSVPSVGDDVSGGGHVLQQHGGDFIVPPGFYNDDFLVGVTSGERVRVETEAQQRRGDINYNFSLNANYRYQDERSLKDDVRLMMMLYS